LAYDFNQDGVITMSQEFVFTEWAPQALTDMQALALVFDSNRDGVLSSLDREWSKFGLWVDANGNAVNDEGEYLSLDDLGVVSINLDYQPGSVSTIEAVGDVIVAGTSLVTWADGSSTQAADALFMAELPVMSQVEADPLIGIAADGSAPVANPDLIEISGPPLSDSIDAFVASLLQNIHGFSEDDSWLAILSEQWPLAACDSAVAKPFVHQLDAWVHSMERNPVLSPDPLSMV
jgi:hypothetical protein